MIFCTHNFYASSTAGNWTVFLFLLRIISGWLLPRDLSQCGFEITYLCRVTEVSADSFCVVDKKTRKAEHQPYGICVWSTGISPRPIATTMMKRFGQGERLVQAEQS